MTKSKTKKVMAKKPLPGPFATADEVGRFCPNDPYIEVNVKGAPMRRERNPHYVAPMPSLDTKAPDGQSTLGDVIEALRAVRDACGKDQALAILRSGGAASVRDLEPRCYDAVVDSCKRVAALARAMSARSVPRMPYALHFALRALEAILKGDPVLIRHAAEAMASDHYLAHLDLVHEEGRRAATALLGVAKGALKTGYPTMERPVVKAAMERHLRAIETALNPKRYDWTCRLAAVAHVRAAIELWSVAVSV